MVPIVITSDKQFDPESFREYLLEMCAKHKAQGRALAFAFIVYDFYDHTVVQILKNEDYWTALHKLSGRFLSIFYVNSQNEYYRRLQRETYEKEKRQRSDAIRKGHISFLTPLVLKPTPLDNAIELIKEDFQLEDGVKQPFVLFFQTDGDEILDYFVVTLKQEKLEDAFLELKAHIKNAVEAIANVQPENYHNHQEIFNLLKEAVGQGRFYALVKRKVLSKLSIGTIITLIKLIADR